MKNNSHHLPGMKSFKGKLLQITILNSKEKSFQIKNFFFQNYFLRDRFKLDGQKEWKWTKGWNWTVQSYESGLVCESVRLCENLLQNNRLVFILDTIQFSHLKIVHFSNIKTVHFRKPPTLSLFDRLLWTWLFPKILRWIFQAI